MLAIARAEFLAAIGLHARSLHAVHAQATERLYSADDVVQV